MGQWLSERLGQPFVVENRPGGGTNIATEAVVRASADGYTLLLVHPANAINATLYDKLNFNFIRDIAPVAGVIRGPFVMLVNPSFPAKTVPEFIAYAKANPGVINFASGGTGFATHVAGELFKVMTEVNMVHVPHPTGKGAGVDDIRLVPAARSEERCPRLEIQSWRSGKAGGPEYRRLRSRRRLGTTCAADIAALGATIQRAHELLVPVVSIINWTNADAPRRGRRRSIYVVQVVVQV